jgi:NADH:ubiquinone oxidoreductase subunit C
MKKNSFITNLLKNIPCKKINKNYNEIICFIPVKYVLPCLTFLRDNNNCQFSILSTITATDYPGKCSRFEICYELLSLCFNVRIRIKTFVNEITSIHSITSIFLCAD